MRGRFVDIALASQGIGQVIGAEAKEGRSRTAVWDLAIPSARCPLFDMGHCQSCVSIG